MEIKANTLMSYCKTVNLGGPNFLKIDLYFRMIFDQFHTSKLKFWGLQTYEIHTRWFRKFFRR